MEIPIKKFISFGKRAGVLRKPVLYRPYRDWKIIATVFVVLAVIAAALGTYLFLGVQKGEVFGSDRVIEKPKEVIDKGHLKEVIDSFDQRKIEREKLNSSRPSLVDPS